MSAELKARILTKQQSIPYRINSKHDANHELQEIYGIMLEILELQAD